MSSDRIPFDYSSVKSSDRLRFDHSLFGFKARYTKFAILFIGIVVVATVLDDALSRGAIDFVPSVLALPIEVLIAVLVLFLALSAAVFPALYGLINGGPLVAAAISLVPKLTVALVSGTWVLTNDFMVALLGAAIGAGIAVGHQFYRVQDRRRIPSPLVDGLFVATVLTILAIVGALRFVGGAPPPAIIPIRHWLWAALVPTVICLGCWIVTIRSWGVEEIIEIE